MASSITAIFVYGTLKRGQINHPLIGPHAGSIESGSVRGRLYDVGEFPALVEGDDRVHGEIVRLEAADVQWVLSVLDRLEGCIPGDDERSLYRRRVVEAITEGGDREQVHCYLYNPDHPAVLPLDALVYLPQGIWPNQTGEQVPGSTEELERYRRFVRSFADEAGTPE